jgi:hypothetical protein
MAGIGSDVALRDIWFGQVWRANAARVVADGDVVALWMPTGSPAKYPIDSSGAEVRIPQPAPVLADRRATRDTLALVQPRRRHSIWLFWTPERELDHWYVNFERPLGWGSGVFDTVDEKLDLIVDAAGTLRWKDEDELEHAAALGLVEAAEVRAEAARVVAEWPFPTGWEDFRPDPRWPVPRLPVGWDAAPPLVDETSQSRREGDDAAGPRPR